MKPPPFEYRVAESVEAAVAMLAEAGDEAKVLAGGQSLVPMLNFRLLRPAILVDINRIAGLADIEEQADEIRVGALTRHHQLETSPVIATHLPVLSAAMTHVAHLAIRNRGTIGGSLTHADPAAELPMMALLLDATISVTSPKARRTVAAGDFFLGALSVALEADELVTEVTFPKLPPNTGWGFEEVSRRQGDFALTAVGAALTVSDGTIAEARIAVAGAHECAVRAGEAEALLKGRALEPKLLDAACDAARACVAPNTDLHASADYRRHLVGVLTAQGAHRCVGPCMTTIRMTVNGTAYERAVEPRLLLVDFLRGTLGLTGTHVGCEHGVCGACTVLVDGDSMRSCLLFAVQLDGCTIETVESLGTLTNLSPLQEAFREHHALQCGFCTPGMLMTATDLLRKYPLATDEQIREGLSGNLCRCTGYEHIVKAIRAVVGNAR